MTETLAHGTHLRVLAQEGLSDEYQYDSRVTMFWQKSLPFFALDKRSSLIIGRVKARDMAPI